MLSIQKLSIHLILLAYLLVLCQDHSLVHGQTNIIRTMTDTISCNSQCATCSGPTEFNCTSCATGQTLNLGICANNPTMLYLTTRLQITTDPTIVNLLMFPRVSAFATKINSLSQIYIDNGANKNFSYSFIDTGNNIIQIKFNFLGTVALRTSISLNYTEVGFSDNSNTFSSVYSLKQTNLSGQLIGYIPYSTSQLDLIQQSQNIAIYTSIVAQICTAILAIIGFDSSLMYINIQSYDLFDATKFLNIKYPPNLIELLGDIKSEPVTLTFLPNVFNNININSEDSIKKAPAIFDLYNVKPGFMQNYGAEVFQFLLLAFVVGILGILHKSNKNPKNNVIEILFFIIWNFFISFILSNYFKGMMFIMLQFSQISTDSSFQNFNLAMNIIYILLIPLPFLTAIFSIKYFLNLVAKDEEKPSSEMNNLVADFNADHMMQLLYPSLCLIRGFLVFTFLIWIIDNPRVILILWLIMTFIILLIVILFRPFVHLWHTIRQVGCEILNAIFYCFALVINDKNDKNNINDISDTGFMMLQVNSAFFIWMVLFVIIDLLYAIWRIIQKLQKKPKVEIKIQDKEYIEVLKEEKDFSPTSVYSEPMTPIEYYKPLNLPEISRYKESNLPDIRENFYMPEILIEPDQTPSLEGVILFLNII